MGNFRFSKNPRSFDEDILSKTSHEKEPEKQEVKVPENKLFSLNETLLIVSQTEKHAEKSKLSK